MPKKISDKRAKAMVQKAMRSGSYDSPDFWNRVLADLGMGRENERPSPIVRRPKKQRKG